jgi:hypothetical protein
MLIFVNIYSLYNQTLSLCGRGEIGKHKGLKRLTINHRVTGHPPNSFKYNNYLVDTLSDVALSIVGKEVTL